MILGNLILRTNSVAKIVLIILIQTAKYAKEKQN